MKYLILLLITTILSTFLSSQTPVSFNYQAAVRDVDGTIQKNIIKDFLVEILQGDSLVYSEEHFDINTGDLGIVNFKIGTGENQTDDLQNIDWSNASYQLRITIDEEEIGTADIVAVPFALYAKSAGSSYWKKNDSDSSLYYSAANVGVGVQNPKEKLDVNGRIFMHGSDAFIHSIDDNGNRHELIGNYQGFTEGEKSIFIAGYNAFNHSDRSTEKVKFGGWPNTAMTIQLGENQSDGKVGIGTESPLGKLHITSDNWTDVIIESSGPSHDPSIYLRSLKESWRIHNDHSDSGKLKFGLWRNGSPVLTNALVIDGNGKTSVKVLEILGGGDIKEDFDSIEDLEAGDVVVIDENNPGNIKRTNKEYDRKVAGVISGANGIKPGISLSQQDILEGEYPLTMVGRAYVKVIGVVIIGDLLTTSLKPGFAMAVKDFSMANGTVIGKAMTANEEGNGLVLALINLQ